MGLLLGSTGCVRRRLLSLEMQRMMPLVDGNPRNPLEEDAAVRIGMRSGKLSFMNDMGKIISDVINLPAAGDASSAEE